MVAGTRIQGSFFFGLEHWFFNTLPNAETL